MYQVITLVVPIFGLILIGYGCAKYAAYYDQKSNKETSDLTQQKLYWLNTFVIYVALPALFFKLLSQTPFEELTNASYILATTTATFIIFAATFILSIVISRTPITEAAIRGTAAGYGNIGYMGPAISITALGQAAAVPATLIICFDNLIFFTFVPLFAALGVSTQKSLLQTMVEILQKVALHPFIVSSALGILAAYYQLQIPLPLENLLNYLSAAAAPCALFALGVTMAAQRLKRIPNEMPVLIFAKLILHPILAYYMVKTLADPSPTWLYTAVLLAALPPAANVFVLASQYKTYVERASSTILIGTVSSVVTVTALLYAIENNLLP